MTTEAIRGPLGQILAVLVLAATLSGCGGASNVGSAGSAGSASNASTSSSSTATSSASATSPALIALSSADYTAAPSSTALVSIYRQGSAQGTATAGYTTVNGSAIAGADYVPTSGTVTWQDGDTSPKVVSIPVTNQASGKQFLFSLTSLQGQASFGSPAVAEIGIGGYSGPPPTPGAVTLSWMAPSENTNGSALTDLAGYVILYGTSASSMTETITVSTVGVQSYVVSDLASGTWYFRVVAVNSQGVQSVPSGTVSATI